MTTRIDDKSYELDGLRKALWTFNTYIGRSDTEEETLARLWQNVGYECYNVYRLRQGNAS